MYSPITSTAMELISRYSASRFSRSMSSLLTAPEFMGSSRLVQEFVHECNRGLADLTNRSRVSDDAKYHSIRLADFGVTDCDIPHGYILENFLGNDDERNVQRIQKSRSVTSICFSGDAGPGIVLASLPQRNILCMRHPHADRDNHPGTE